MLRVFVMVLCSPSLLEAAGICFSVLRLLSTMSRPAKVPSMAMTFAEAAADWRKCLSPAVSHFEWPRLAWRCRAFAGDRHSQSSVVASSLSSTDMLVLRRRDIAVLSDISSTDWLDWFEQ